MLLLIIFRKLQKISFWGTFIFANKTKVFISPVKPNHSYDTYDFVKTAKICETYDYFCDVGRYPTVIWTNQHSASVSKKIFEILTQEFPVA